MRFFTSLTLFVAIAIVLLLLSLGAVVYVWNLVQGQSGSYQYEQIPALDPHEGFKNDNKAKPSSSTPQVVSTSSVEDKISESATVLTEEQIAQAVELGIDVSTIDISEEVVVCATEAVGIDRIEAFKSGETPTFFESIALLACLKNNE